MTDLCLSLRHIFLSNKAGRNELLEEREKFSPLLTGLVELKTIASIKYELEFVNSNHENRGQRHGPHLKIFLRLKNDFKQEILHQGRFCQKSIGFSRKTERNLRKP